MNSRDYRNTYWFEFREKAFIEKGRYCNRCSRTNDEVTLQVHHKIYKSGFKPWEYDIKDCEVLCSGCHAREHGHIRPSHSWHISHSVDLGSLIGECELCGQSIRHLYHVFHNEWSEELVVGINCCDNLVDSEEVNTIKKQQQAFVRFLKSERWVKLNDDSSYYVKNVNFTFWIIRNGSRYFIKVNKFLGKKPLASKLEAQLILFDYIRNYTYLKHFNEKGYRIKSHR